MAYFDTKSGSLEEAIRQAVGGQKIEEKMDAVNKTAVKKKFDDRKDKDIDNDGDVDSSDKFLHKRRKAISKAVSKDEGNKFGKELKAARDKGEKTFVVSGRTYKVEDYNQDEAYKPVKSNHYDVKIQGVKKKDVNAILKYIKVDGGNYDIEDVDADQVTGGGMSSTSAGDIFIQGNDAGKLGMEIAKKFRSVKVMGEDYQKEELDDKDKESVKDVVKGLKKAVKTHQGQVASLTKDIKDEVDVKEGKMKELAMKIASVYTKMKKDKQMKPFADKFRADVKTSMNIRKSLEKVLPDYVGGGNITKLMGENFIGTPETTKARLDATPGQSSDDWNEQVGIMQKKNTSMREALAKVWGFEEGHNPFKKEMHDMKKKPSKKEGKTMTGQPETKVVIDPDMKEKVK